MGKGVGFGVIVGVGTASLILSEAFIISGGPLEGFSTTVASCIPIASPAILADSVTIEDAPAASLPLPGLTDSQGCDGVVACQLTPAFPVLTIVIVCDGGLLPTVVENDTAVALICTEGDEGGDVTFSVTPMV